MEKKYYDIIVSLVKQNEKYAGCEPILDDIVQDVYDHSKVVLGSVTNEDVISAYLNKVVATSLITVPKKLNFNTRNKHRIISNVEAITNVSLPQKKEEVVEEEEPLTLTELETSDTLSEPEELTFEPELLEEEPVITEVVEEIQEIEPEAPQEEELAEESIIEEPVAIEEEELTFEADEPESLSFDMQDEAPVEIEEIITESVAEPEETFELAVEETEEEDDFFAIPEAEQDVDKTLVDKMINGVPSEIEELSPLEETETEPFELIEETEDEPVSIEQVAEEEVVEESFELDLDNSEVLEELEPAELEEVSDLSSDYKVPTFECFSYEPEKPEFFEDEICADLQEFDSKHPEKKLLQVCKLKYEEKLSVSEIAEKLEFSEETVLDTLNDIIELVKD